MPSIEGAFTSNGDQRDLKLQLLRATHPLHEMSLEMSLEIDDSGEATWWCMLSKGLGCVYDIILYDYLAIRPSL